MSPTADQRPSRSVSVTYWMNRLQNLPDETPLFVSVNPGRAPLPPRPMRASPSSIRCTTPRRSARSAACMRSRACATPISAAATAATASTRMRCRPASTWPSSSSVRRPWPRPDEHRRIGDPPRVVADRPIARSVPAAGGGADRDRDVMSGAASHAVIDATVVHRRLRPRENAFRYRVAYLCLDLGALETAAGRWLKLDRPGLVSFRRADHGARDGGDLAAWLRGILAGHGLGRGLRRRGRADDHAAHAGLRLQSGELLVLPRPRRRAAGGAVRGQQHLRREPLLSGPS